MMRTRAPRIVMNAGGTTEVEAVLLEVGCRPSRIEIEVHLWPGVSRMGNGDRWAVDPDATPEMWPHTLECRHIVVCRHETTQCRYS